VFPSDARRIHEALASEDKQLQMIEGDHYLLKPEGARDGVADLIADWVHKRAGRP
jgi:hypothetical protein